MYFIIQKHAIQIALPKGIFLKHILLSQTGCPTLDVENATIKPL